MKKKVENYFLNFAVRKIWRRSVAPEKAKAIDQFSNLDLNATRILGY